MPLLASIVSVALAQAPPAPPAGGESRTLGPAVQLTFPDRFIKAGEAYFSPDAKRIVFQAIEKAADGGPPDEFYAMFVADCVRDASGAVTGLADIRRVSPPGSANTCGWFDPSRPGTLIFASTVVPPTESDAPGYQRGTGRYKWMFPREMRIVEVDLAKADGSAGSLEPLVGDGTAYVAEGATSPDGRHLIHCDLATGQGDLYVLDRKTGKRLLLVGAPGYDGGPFFSPEGRRIAYRSDRDGDNLLQVFVADLEFAADGSIVGVREERQVTRNGHVNWAPFWHPDGKTLVFASSAMGHRNYEVFAADAAAGSRSASDPTPQSRYGTNFRRITDAEGADVLPVFSPDGKWMMWTGQRGEDRSSQLYVAEWRDLPPEPPAASGGPRGR
jgi:dipeptidyl aminopeptidase/acylaminoacyl peptidase